MRNPTLEEIITDSDEDERGFIDLSEHFLRISRLLYSEAVAEAAWQMKKNRQIAEESWLGGVAEPLHIAGSIESIGVTPSALNPETAGWCNAGAEYDDALSEITAAYLRELTRFMWAWIALEKLASSLCEKKGTRTERVIQFLKQSPNVLWEEAKSLGKGAFSLLDPRICVHTKFSTFPLRLFDEKIYNRIGGLLLKERNADFWHIHICREVRNELFHAHSVTLSPPEDYEIFKDPRVRLPKTLCRITLLIIQSVLYTCFYNSKCLTDDHLDSEGVLPNIPLHIAIRRIHIADTYIHHRQPELFPWGLQ